MSWFYIFQWSAILIASLYVLIRGSDLFVEGAKRLGRYFGLSSFVIGVLIVGLGTSLPELASSLAAVWEGSTEIVLANAVGSNIANILLIIGTLALLGGPIMVSGNLLKTELPIFFIATVHFVFSVYDGVVDRIESVLLFFTLCTYIWYLLSFDKDEKDKGETEERNDISGKREFIKDIVFVLMGITAVLIGANYTVKMAVNIATGLNVPIGLVSIAAIAIGTSLPELFVSLQAIKTGETELAVGNVFGSNAFNILLVVGIPGMFKPLLVDDVVSSLGLPILIAASLILFIIGLAQQIQRWEGVAMLIFFLFFLVKLVSFV